MTELTVEKILDDNAKHGTSKAGKPWSQSRVELSNGESVFIFNPIEQGDKVIGKQTGEYLNYVKVQPDPKHDEIMSALRSLYKQNQQILSLFSSQDKNKLGKKEAEKPDTVIEDIGDEPINLDDIPFGDNVE